MEQYIQDWLKEHPEAREIVVSAWNLGTVAGLEWEPNKEWSPCPFAQPQEVKAA